MKFTPITVNITLKEVAEILSVLFKHIPEEDVKKLKQYTQRHFTE